MFLRRNFAGVEVTAVLEFGLVINGDVIEALHVVFILFVLAGLVVGLKTRVLARLRFEVVHHHQLQLVVHFRCTPVALFALDGAYLSCELLDEGDMLGLSSLGNGLHFFHFLGEGTLQLHNDVAREYEEVALLLGDGCRISF